MQLLNFTIIKLTICLIIGVVIGYLIDIPLKTSLLLSTSLLTILFIFYLVAKKQFIKTIWFGLFAFGLMISIGILTTNIHNQKNFSNHYTQELLTEKDTLKTITFRIKEVLKSNTYYNKYIIDILKVNTKEVSGKSLLNIAKDSLQTPLKVDAIFISKTAFNDLTHPLNPHQFDYKNFLDKKYIYHQLYATNESLLYVESDTQTLLGLADNTRQYINKKLKPYNFKPNERSIINALLLGQRQELSKDIYNSYTNAGVIHILAVSGLHVGIILLILSFVLKPLERFKHGKLIKTILLVSMLWSFALIAGLSPSITRAVTMFSIVAIALNLKRPTNIYNTLAISVFIILLFKPLFIFDVGFQLSYLAVFSIVSLDPILYKLWVPKNKIIDFYWHTFTVTMSAQIGIIPLSLFYFHQFPSLFFISNLVIIPFLGVILGFGILVLVLAVLNLLPQLVSNIYGSIISFMNNFVKWISTQESFLFKDIPFSFLYVLVSYFLIISFIRFLIKKNYSTLRVFLVVVLVAQISVIYTNYNKPSNAFIVFHKSKHSLLGNLQNNTILVSHDLDSLTKLKNNTIKDYAVGNHFKNNKEVPMQPIYQLKNKTLLIVDSLGVYNVKLFKPDYILLRQSPKVNLNRLIDSIKPQQIIADGSNYKSYVARWETICKKRKLPFHQTGKKGAFIIDY
ncbi:ComEC/Rec2 family competence protein [Flaviramulus aquimarinus]|uniref:ComEC/Rec2 family competence protein n=1 Tax=Flaviramulus aquimarinus TaxID=1170456 RepID=A0ABP9EW15_9FLAO